MNAFFHVTSKVKVSRYPFLAFAVGVGELPGWERVETECRAASISSLRKACNRGLLK